jgi:hypothetical protein
VTGLAGHRDYLYLGSRSQGRTYRYSLPGIYGRTSSTRFGSSKTWDIARDPSGRIWAAVDDSECSLRLFDSSGNSVDSISRDIVSSARGVALDDQGILWVSCGENGVIYGIDTGE